MTNRYAMTGQTTQAYNDQVNYARWQREQNAGRNSKAQPSPIQQAQARVTKDAPRAANGSTPPAAGAQPWRSVLVEAGLRTEADSNAAGLGGARPWREVLAEAGLMK